jgi:simple sugar transport system permease protein
MGPFDTNWLVASVLLSTPLIYAAMGELIAERSGILNVGLEGMMLGGAFFGYLVAWKSGSIPLGVVAAMGAGGALAALMAILSIQARANQIVVGVGIWIFGIGLTGYLLGLIFPGGSASEINTPGRVAIPLLSHIPLLGRVLFNQSAFVYGAFLTFPLAWVLLYRTRFGLAVRAAGELPAAVDTSGMSVWVVRWAATLIAGVMAGLGGAFLSLGDLGLFGRQMTAGRGFLAIAAVIFGRWEPRGAFLACLLFGSADALELRLQAEPTVPRQVWLVVALVALAYLIAVLRRGRSEHNRLVHLSIGGAACVAFLTLFGAAPQVSAPNQVWLALPYVLTLFALAGVVGRADAPSAWAVPYDRRAI